MTRRSFGLALAFALAVAAWPGGAAASAFDLEGFGPVGVAEIGARAARADDGTATFYNPGGLGLGRGVTLEIAPTLGVSALAAQGATQALADPFGVALAFAATVPLEGVLRDRIRFGFGSYVVPAHLARIIVPHVDQPTFPYFQNRTQRLVVLPALAVKLTRGLAIGGGVNVLGGVTGTASLTNGESGAPEPRIDAAAQTQAAAVLGARFDPTPWFHLALVYRQQFSVPSRVATDAVVGGVPLSVSIDAAQNLFDPHTIVAATSFEIGRLELEIDASYAVWSSYTAPFVAVHAVLPAVDIEGGGPSHIARDVVSARAAAAYGFHLGDHRLFLRGALGFEPTMLTSFQQGTTNLVDGDKLLVGLGASLELAHVVGHALRFGFGANATIVMPYRQDKIVCASAPCPDGTVAGPDAAHPSQGITDPGSPTLRGTGAFFATSLGVGVDL